jgi:uncharacterized membrane protein YedE/YeeE
VKANAFTFALAIAFGFALSRIGFASWDQVHAMLTFADLRLVFTFGLAVALLALGWTLLGLVVPERMHFRRREIHRGTLVGGLLFGAGWALSGACPAVAFVQIGEGQLAAGWTLLGILAGNYAYGVLHARYLRWDAGSCLDE